MYPHPSSIYLILILATPPAMSSAQQQLPAPTPNEIGWWNHCLPIGNRPVIFPSPYYHQSSDINPHCIHSSYVTCYLIIINGPVTCTKQHWLVELPGPYGKEA